MDSARVYILPENVAASILVALSDSEDALAAYPLDPDAAAAGMACAEASADLAETTDLRSDELWLVWRAAERWRAACEAEDALHSRWRQTGAAEDWHTARAERKAALEGLAEALGVKAALERLG